MAAFGKVLREGGKKNTTGGRGKRETITFKWQIGIWLPELGGETDRE